MPGLGAAAEEGGSSHCNLAGRACLTVASWLVNQKTVAPKTKMAEIAINHWRVVMLKKASSVKQVQLSKVNESSLVKQSFCKFTRIKSLKVIQLLAHANEVNRNGFFAGNGAQHAAFGRAVELGDNEPR